MTTEYVVYLGDSKGRAYEDIKICDTESEARKFVNDFKPAQAAEYGHYGVKSICIDKDVKNGTEVESSYRIHMKRL